MTAQNIVIAVTFLLLGWVLHMMWDGFVDWLYDTTGWASSILWDVCAVIGVLAVCVTLGFTALHYHWLGISN